VTADGPLLSEQTFFERCAPHPTLHPRMVRYSDNLVDGMRGITTGLVGNLCHDEWFPAGSFAVVPLALGNCAHVPALVRHLRGVDLTHESFHVALIDRIVGQHGIVDETLDLLAFRASDGSGAQAGTTNIWLAARAHRLLELWSPWGGSDGFATRIHRISED